MAFKRIAVDPEVCGGKPCIRGMRFPVSFRISCVSRSGVFFDAIQPFVDH
jgi:uncharacterized protein (DUF433 family)